MHDYSELVSNITDNWYKKSGMDLKMYRLVTKLHAALPGTPAAVCMYEAPSSAGLFCLLVLVQHPASAANIDTARYGFKTRCGSETCLLGFM